MAITYDDAKQFAQAIAVANGHPDPDQWSRTVADAFLPPQVLNDAPAQNIAAENSLHPETPAV